MFKYAGLVLLIFAGAASASTSDLHGIDQTPAEAVTFSEAYRTILDRSVRLQNQRLLLEETRARKLQSTGTFLPSVSASYSDSQGDPFTGARRSAALNGKVNLFRSGADLAGIHAAGSDVEASRSTLAKEQQNAEEDAAAALIDFIAQSQLVEIGAKQVAVQNDSLRIARERFAKGLLPQQEVDKTSIDLEIARARLAEAQTALTEAAAKLEAALGHTKVRLEWPWRTLLQKSAEVETMTFDIKNRPDWQAALATTESGRWRKRQAFSSLLPSLDLTASYGNGDLSDPARRDWATVLTLSVPLFDGFKNWGDFKVQSYEELRAQVAQETLLRLAGPQVENLRQSHRIARESAMAREKTADLSSRLYTDNLQRFKLGRATANDLAIEQGRLLNAQQLEVRGWQVAHQSLLRLCHSLGGYVEPSGTCRAR